LTVLLLGQGKSSCDGDDDGGAGDENGDHDAWLAVGQRYSFAG